MDAASGPSLLFGARMITSSLATLAAIAALLNAWKPNEIESTWDKEDCKRFAVIGWMRAVALIAVALYYLCAGVFEVDRTSSPHRLLVGNIAMSSLFLGLWIDSVAWRFHYRRKRVINGKGQK